MRVGYIPCKTVHKEGQNGMCERGLQTYRHLIHDHGCVDRVGTRLYARDDNNVLQNLYVILVEIHFWLDSSDVPRECCTLSQIRQTGPSCPRHMSYCLCLKGSAVLLVGSA
jgi:hypothetical protein